MTERIDHAKVAQRNLDFVGREAMESPEALVTVTAAQVHATLALVEQQRITNLIALGQQNKLIGNGQKLEQVLSSDVREGLGL